MAQATPSDVRVEIDTHLDDTAVDAIIDRIEREWKRYYKPGDFSSTQHQQDFEAALTALRIAEGRDRRADEVTSGRTATSYEEPEVAALRKRVRRADPGDEFGHDATIRRDDDRYTTTS